MAKGEQRGNREAKKIEKRKAESSSGDLPLCQTRKGGQRHPFGRRKEVVHSLTRACNAHCALRRTPSWGRLPGQVAAETSNLVAGLRGFLSLSIIQRCGRAAVMTALAEGSSLNV